MTLDYDETGQQNKENKNILEFIFFFILCVTDVNFIYIRSSYTVKNILCCCGELFYFLK